MHRNLTLPSYWGGGERCIPSLTKPTIMACSSNFRRGNDVADSRAVKQALTVGSLKETLA